MKAIIQTGYGSADVLALAEIERPQPSPGRVLVRVHAASLGAGDCLCVRGSPFPARIGIGLFSPKPDHVVGLDFAGVIGAVGVGVSGFKPGDLVYGECLGACAEYAVASATRIASMPSNLPFAEAAAIPTSACTALQGLRDHGRVRPGQRLLINGAAGGVGTFAVQLGKVFGAEVTGVCSPSHVELVRGLGADRVVDYTKEDFTIGASRYDVILDNVGNHSLSDARRALTPNGIHIPCSGRAGLGWMLRAALDAAFVRRQSAPFVGVADRESLAALAELIEAGKLRPVIDRMYPLAQTADAVRYLDGGHAGGKVVVSMVSGNLAQSGRSR